MRIVYMITKKDPYRSTYDEQHDSFLLKYAIIPCAVIACIFNNHNSIWVVYLIQYIMNSSSLKSLELKVNFHFYI